MAAAEIRDPQFVESVVVGDVHADVADAVADAVVALMRGSGGKRGAAVDPLAVRIVEGYPLAEYRACAGRE